MVEEIIPELKINDLGHDGRGVGKLNGYTVFIPGTLPGERVRARLVKKKKRFGEALLEEVLDASPHRRKPPCPVYSECGGCQLQHMDYPFQVEFKQDRLVQALYRIGEAKDFPAPRIHAAGKEWNYRNKATYHLQGSQVGFFSRQSRRVIPHEECALLPQEVNQIKKSLAELLKQKIITSGKNFTVRTSFSHQQSLLILDQSVKPGSSWEKVTTILRQENPELLGIYQQGKGKREGRGIWGKSRIKEKMGDYTFELGPATFFQVNSEQREVLLKRAKQIVLDLGCRTVGDLYAGAGVFGINLAKHVDRVLAIEISREAVAEGKRQVKHAGLENIEFHRGEVERAFAKLPRELDCVLVDPPREGCHPNLWQLIEEKKVKNIVYISCNPATLARDIAELQPLGYRIETLDLIDMFPQTYHVECLVRLCR